MTDTGPFIWYRIQITSDSGDKSWFTVIYRNGRDANVAANYLMSDVPGVQTATVYRNDPSSDPEDTFVAEYRKGLRE